MKEQTLNKVVPVFLLMQFLLMVVSAQQSFDPVNKNATPEAVALLDYMYSVKGKKIISGHCAEGNNLNKWHQYIQDLTGKQPAIWGSGFMHYYEKGYADKMVQEAIKRHRQGHIITLMWHVGRPQDNPPFDWKNSVQGEMTD